MQYFPRKSPRLISGEIHFRYRSMSIHALSLLTQISRYLVKKFFCAEVFIFALFCAERAVSGFTLTPQLGFAFLSASSVCQSSPASMV